MDAVPIVFATEGSPVAGECGATLSTHRRASIPVRALTPPYSAWPSDHHRLPNPRLNLWNGRTLRCPGSGSTNVPYLRTLEGGRGSYRRDGPGSNSGRLEVGGGCRCFGGAAMATCSGCGERDGGIGHGKTHSRTGLARVCGDVQLAGTLGPWRTCAVRLGVAGRAAVPGRG